MISGHSLEVLQSGIIKPRLYESDFWSVGILEPRIKMQKNLPSLKDRRSGLLLHLSSLPGPYYCGDLGKAAFKFAEFLDTGGQSWWQMLPVNPIGLGNSPYNTTCSFAGEPLFIDLEGLVKDGLLKKSEIVTPQAVSPNRIYYQKARRYRKSRLKAAFERFTAGHGDLESSPFYQFRSEHKYWLEDFALFCVLAKKFKTRHWPNWPSDVRRRKKAALEKVRSAFKKELDFIATGKSKRKQAPRERVDSARRPDANYFRPSKALSEHCHLSPKI
jgi:4-alpha-glucanotransferase